MSLGHRDEHVLFGYDPHYLTKSMAAVATWVLLEQHRGWWTTAVRPNNGIQGCGKLQQWCAWDTTYIAKAGDRLWMPQCSCWVPKRMCSALSSNLRGKKMSIVDTLNILHTIPTAFEPGRQTQGATMVNVEVDLWLPVLLAFVLPPTD